MPDNNVIATNEIQRASPFFIKPIDDGDNPYEFLIAHYGEKSKKRSSTTLIMEPQNLEPIARYLEAPVNVLGKNPGPLCLKQNTVQEISRFALHSRLVASGTPVMINEWISGRDIFYINCSRREWARDGYLCVKETEGSKYAYITACVSSTKSHNNSTCYMLFRLLPTKLQEQSSAFNAIHQRSTKSDTLDFQVLMESDDDEVARQKANSADFSVFIESEDEEY